MKVLRPPAVAPARCKRRLGNADESESCSVSVDDGARARPRPQGVLHDRGGHAGDYVGVGDDQAVIATKPGAGGGLNRISARPESQRRLPRLVSAADSTVSVGAGFGGDRLADFGMVPKASTSLRT